MMTTSSRNAPCPCGSGLRYKECHGALAGPADRFATRLADRVAALMSAGQLDEASALLAANAAHGPADPELALLAAKVALALGDRALAIQRCRELVVRAPAHVAAWNLLGEILRPDDVHGAEAAWRAAVAAEPTDPEAHFHLGNLARERGAFELAIAEYRQALLAQPEHAAVLNNLGLAYTAAGDGDAAESCYRQVLARDAGNADALANLANVLFARGQYVATEDTYERLFALRPTLPAYVWLQRGHGLQRQSRFVDAETCYRAALADEPNEPRVLSPLAQVLLEQDRPHDALPVLERALRNEPDSVWARAMLISSKLQLCDWSGLESQYAYLRDFLDRHPDGGQKAPNPFGLLGMPLTPAQLLAASRGWARGLQTAGTAPVFGNANAPDGRLRVGFVSADLRPHAISFLALEHWEKLRGGRLETYAYSLNADAQGEYGERIRGAFDHYINVAEDAAAAIATRIRADGIGVLMDCNGYTKHGRPEIFALRPAPVQVNYLGYPGTLGTACHDYILVDGFGLPPQHESWFTEKPLRMPHASFPSDTSRRPSGPPPTRAEHGLPESAFVFCCFNNNAKIQPEVFAVWMRLLAATEGSVMWLLACGDEAERNMRREAAARGIPANRLVFARRTDMLEYLARQPLADLFLDTLPYAAHTTANDALLMGLPILTCAGDTLASRIAGSQLLAIGLPELVTTTLAEYEAAAMRFAHDRPLLREIRERLAANRHSHPLFDMRRYSADFQDLVVDVWERHRATAR